MYVEEVPHTHKGKTYITYLIRKNYRSQGKVKHRTLCNISKLPLILIDQIKRLVKQPNQFIQPQGPFRTADSREFGASLAAWQVACELGLDELIYSRKEPWRQDVMAMIVGRIVYQGSKLSLINMYQDTVVWELAGFAPGCRPDVEEHCYKPLDRLLERQGSIQKALAQRHLKDGCLILYDLTSVYLEGAYEQSELVSFGKSRDCKRGHEQITLGLLTNKNGCPVACEVFAGNTSDQTTVLDKAKMVAETYGVHNVIFAGDRGMLTPKRIEEVTELGYKTITALTHPAIMLLLERKVIQLSLFDEQNIAEVKDPDIPGLRYMLCKNPQTQKEETATRTALIEKTKEKLDALINSKKRRTEQQLSAAVGVAIAKYKVAKFFDWKIENGRLAYSVNDQLVQKEQALDGCYIIRTDVDANSLTKDQAVYSYRQLTTVEQAFRSLKTVALEIRPIYHHLDDRIRAHAFLCMLAYYVQWHMWQRLQPLLQEDGEESERRWTWKNILHRLRSIRKEKAYLGKVEIGDIVTTPDEEQHRILAFLKVKM